MIVSTDLLEFEKKYQESRSSTPTSPPKSLPLDSVTTLEAVFQLRNELTPYQIEKLVRVIRSGQTVDPLSVCWCSGRFVLIDGHHRLEAYKKAGFKGKVPVTLLMADTATELCAEALRENSKSKIQMTAEERSEGAWRIASTEMFLADGQLKEAKLKGMVNVSSGQLHNFRKAYKKIKDEGGDPLCMSWKQAQAKLKEDEEPYEYEEEDPWDAAEHILYNLWKLKPDMFGLLQRQPDVLVAAIQLIAGSQIEYSVSRLANDLDMYLDHDNDEF